MDINRVYNENCLDTMAKMSNDFVDLVVTSPPYDNLRDYKGYSFDFESIAKELFRVVKKGGVVVWVVGDATINGSETGTSFRQALYFKEIGFNLHDTMIYAKKSYAPAYPNMKRYAQTFEYMFILSNGKPNTFNPIMVDKQISSISNKIETNGFRQKDGSMVYKKMKTSTLVKSDCNVWVYDVGFNKSSKDIISFEHPATFPEQLANDHIISWSNEGDLVYDPFMGGATAKAAILSNRNYIGSEISAEYCEIIKERLQPLKNNLFT